MFNCRLRLTLFLTGAMALGASVALNAAAHAQPASISPLASASGPITPAQREAIAAYSRHWSSRLASRDAETLTQARRRLLEPLRSPGIRLVFRDEYSRAAIPELERVLDEAEHNLAIVNSLQVMAAFGTEQAMRALVNRADPDHEPRMAARLWAANGFRLAVDEGIVDEQRLTPYIRDLANAAERETEWMVLLREFEALDRVRNELSRERQVGMLRAALDHVEFGGAEAHQLMNAVRRALVLLREQYIVLSPGEQRTMGTAIAPLLGRVLTLGQENWDEIASDEAIRDVYHGAIQQAETHLRIIDRQVRSESTPSTTLDRAWKSADRSTYERDVAAWNTILGRPPYASR